MNRLTNIFMIFILVSCPVRCMTQGCACFPNSSDACCSSVEVSTSSCCSTKQADCCDTLGESSPSQELPPKCRCSCFCSGAIVADVFVVDENQAFQQVIASADTMVWNLVLVDSITKAMPPPDWEGHLHFGAMNRGRQICCQISVLLI